MGTLTDARLKGMTTYSQQRVNPKHEGYWNRMNWAEGRLLDYYRNSLGSKLGQLCWDKAQELSDRHHEAFTMSKREYYG